MDTKYSGQYSGGCLSRKTPVFSEPNLDFMIEQKMLMSWQDKRDEDDRKWKEQQAREDRLWREKESALARRSANWIHFWEIAIICSICDIRTNCRNSVFR